MIDALDMSFEAPFIEDFVSGLNNYFLVVVSDSLSKYIGLFVAFSPFLYVMLFFYCIIFQLLFHLYFVSVENTGPDNLKTSMIIPPPTVIDRVLKELFHEGTFYNF